MHFKYSTLWLIAVVSLLPAFGQDLSQLPVRATKLWELRKQSDKVEALQFVDSDTRKAYLQRNDPPILAFKVTGLEFTDDRTRVEVVSRVKSVLPQIGETDLIIREPWIWKDRKWVMQAMSSTNPFSTTGKRDSGEDRAPPKFQIATPTVDLGQHVQGEIISGRIGFLGNRMEIRNIVPLRHLPSLAFGAPAWTTPAEGYLPFTLDTTLVATDINEVIPLETVGFNDGRASSDLHFHVRIDGKVAFKQAPELIDPAQAGQAEIRIQNMSRTKPLKVISAGSYNPAFVIRDEDLPGPIAPGESGSLIIRYGAQPRPTGAAILLILSETLGAGPNITFPLNVKIPEEKTSPSITREDLERIIKAAPKPNIP